MMAVGPSSRSLLYVGGERAPGSTSLVTGMLSLSPGSVEALARQGLAIAHDPLRGRCLLAAREFQPGDVVLESLPFAYVLNSADAHARCHECFQRSSALLRCTACQYAQYCSKKCQAAQWKRIHKRECVGVRELSQGLNGVARDEALLLTRVLLCLRREKQAMECTGEDVRGLVTHVADARQDGLRWEGNVEIARRVCKALSTAGADPVDEDEACELLCAMQSNNFSMWNELLVSVGSGCYPLGAMINHACTPNCVITYDLVSKRQTFRCIREIKAGEEVVHSYIDIAASTSDRQEKLQVLYGFECTCALCGKGDDPLLVARADGTPVQVGDSELELASMLHAKATSLECDGDEEERDALLQAVAIRAKLLHSLNLDLLASRCALMNTHLVMGDFRGALQQCLHIVSSYEHIYAANHPMIGLQLFTLGDLCENLGAMKAAQEWHRKASEILSITHGRQSDMVELLADKLKQTML